MLETIELLENHIVTYEPQLRALPENKWPVKPAPDKWSKKEILGHLIDSAQNNLRRFLVAQYEDTPHIIYDQDKWVSLSNYQDYPFNDLIDFWVLINKHICRVLKNMSRENAQRNCRTSAINTIEWIATDYNPHLQHHLHHLLELEPFSYQY